MKTNFSELSWVQCEIIHNILKDYSKKCIICIPVYKSKLSDNEKSSLNQLCKIIGNSYEICLICPDNIELNEYIDIAYTNNVYLSFLFPSNDYFKSTETYSYMCETSNFYKCFNAYNYIFIYQLDGWIFTNFLDYYIKLNVDYIGSPWRHGIFHFNEDTIGNGGISLRRIQKFIDICESLTLEDYKKEYVEKEDLFFCKTLKRQIDLKIPNIKNASNFSLQSDWNYFIEKYNNKHLPMCLHAWDKDNEIIKKYIKIDKIQTKKLVNCVFYGSNIKQYINQLKLNIKNNDAIIEIPKIDIKEKHQNIIKMNNVSTKHNRWQDYFTSYYGNFLDKKHENKEQQKNNAHINILIVHYNTPKLTECLIKSINKFVKNECTIYIFDNSDKFPFAYSQDNIKIFDNTHKQIIDFEKELEKYPDKGKEASNTFASYKHCLSVNTCFDLINDNFILLDSDVLLKKDISEIFDETYIFCGDIETNICNIKRLAPFCCFINVKKCKQNGIYYFYENLMHGINYKVEGHKYDTGAAFYKYASQYKYKTIKLSEYIVHYKGASWDPNYINNRAVHNNLTVNQWIKKYKNLWETQNHRVIYTCITNNYESIIDPSYVQNDFDYICFTDNMNYKGNVWKIRNIPEELKKLSDVKQQRIIKICPHKYLPEYDESLWVDGSVDILSNVNTFIEKYCNDKKKSVFIRKHPQANCIYEEGNRCINFKKDISENVLPQLEMYKKEKYPFHNGLVETNIIYRKHNDKYCKKLMDEWANIVKQYSHRDQLSFNYVLWKYGNKGFQYLDENLNNSVYFRWYSKHDRK